MSRAVRLPSIRTKSLPAGLALRSRIVSAKGHMSNKAVLKYPGSGLWVASWAPAVLILSVLPIFGSVGYLGGGGDDWYYLEAARCLVQHGVCVPATHWATRWPLVAPLAGALAMFGESRSSVAIVPFLYAVASTILLAANVRKRFGGSAAMWAAVALVLTPAFFGPILQPSVDIPELAWVLAALLAGQVSLERGSFKAAALCGVALGLAILTRATALAFLVPLALGWLALPRSRRALAFPVALGMLAVLAADGGFYGLIAGDPVLGWPLSLHHTAIPSTELPPGVDLSKSALLNIEFIRNWRRSMGIEVHWIVDPLLNLLADPKCGLTLLGAVLLFFARRKDLATRDPMGWLAWAAAAALIHFLVLTFVLATDPKPRMFLFEIAVAAAVIGVICANRGRVAPPLLAGAVLALMALRALLLSYDAIDLSRASRVAKHWASAQRGRLAVDEWTRRTFALVPAVRDLPPPASAPRLPVLGLAKGSCANVDTSGPHGTPLREARFHQSDPSFLRWMRSHHIAVAEKPVPILCIYAPMASSR